jgi:ribosomal protein L12E/L44/L45/RPP1/RPP2
LTAIQPHLSSALLQLVRSSLNDEPSKEVEYELGIEINERTIEGYLSDLEHYINNLLMIRHEAKPKTAATMK